MSSASEEKPARPLRTADEIRQWIIKELATSLKLDPSQIDTAAPLDTLGIDSLTAIGMTGGLSGWLKRDVPITLLWDYATIDAIAAGLADPDTTPNYRGIAVFQKNGTRVPIFFFPGVGGHPVSFLRLAIALGKEQPCYGLIAPGLIQGEKPLESVEAIARAMLVNLRAVQPKGPYQLAGYSFGGFLAYEAAQHLEAAGETVSLVALFDTFNHKGKQVRPLWQRLFIHIYLLVTKSGRIEYILERVNRYCGLTARLEEDEPAPTDPLARRVHEAHTAAHRKYRPKPYAGAIILFRATRRYWQDIFYRQDRRGGWGKLVDRVQVIDLPGAHHDLLSAEYADLAAEALKPHLLHSGGAS